MSTVMEIESAIRSLPQQEFWKLVQWFDAVKERNWDEQIEADAKTGRLDFLFEEAEYARKSGTTNAWPAGS